MRVVAWAIMATDKDEFPPLLPEGFHSKALADIRTLCVDNPQFARSSTRERIMGRLDAAVKRLADAGIVGELWIDGPEKIVKPREVRRLPGHESGEGGFHAGLGR